MRARGLTGARAALLAGPVVLAFFTGGFFDEAREWAGLVAWALVAVAAVVTRTPLPTSRPARLALGGLGLFAVWTLASTAWAPLAGPAYHEGERVFLYLGALAAAAALLRGPGLRAAEPAVATGALIVVGYGLLERLLPWLVTFQRSVSARGRLDQPLTYWNAMGLVAAIGLVLCARIAGDRGRAAWLRCAAAAAAAPLGLGLYVTFSRGALFALATGLIVLLVAVPTRVTLRAAVLAVGAGAAAALSGAPWAGVTTLAGSHGHRVIEGTVVLVLVLAIAAIAAGRQLAACRGEADGRRSVSPLRLPRHAPWLALAVVIGGFALFLAVGAREHQGSPGTTASRLTTLESNRYSYWRVAWRGFKSEPVHGLGSGGWAVYWLRHRPFAEGARDAHSLYVQTAAELGLVGLILLGGFAAGVGWAARRAHGFAPERAAGPIAVVAVFAAHAAIDWDWEMPAATLPAILFAGVLLALSDLAPVRAHA